MGAPYHNLHGKLSKVFRQFLSQNIGSPVSIYSFSDVVSADANGVMIAEPYIGVRVGQSGPTADGMQLALCTGNRTVTVQLYIRTHAEPFAPGSSPSESSADAHNNLVGSVMDMFVGASDIVDLINVHCQQVGGVRINQMLGAPDQSGPDPVGRSYMTALNFQVMAYPVEA